MERRTKQEQEGAEKEGAGAEQHPPVGVPDEESPPGGLEDEVDQASADSFPGSDPPPW